MTICALVGASEFNAEHFQMMDAEGRSTMSSPSTVGSRILRPSGVRLIWRWGILTLSVTSRASPRFPASPPTKMRPTWSWRCVGRRPSGIRRSTFTVVLAADLIILWRICSFSPFSARRALLSRRLIATVPSRSSPAPMPSDARARCGNGVGFLHERPFLGRLRAWAEMGALDDVGLRNRTSLGLSNEFQGEAVMVGVEKGHARGVYAAVIHCSSGAVYTAPRVIDIRGARDAAWTAGAG